MARPASNGPSDPPGVSLAMNRRLLLQGFAAALLMRAGIVPAQSPEARAKGQSVEDLQRDWKTLLAKDAKSPAMPRRSSGRMANGDKRSIRRRMTCCVTKGTERPFSSPLNEEKRPGVFVCAGCALPLFTSAMKFESGTGWPSYFTTIPGAFATKHRQEDDLAAHRISLREMRRASRPRVRRRSAADRAALLQQRRRIAFHSGEGVARPQTAGP